MRRLFTACEQVALSQNGSAELTTSAGVVFDMIFVINFDTSDGLRINKKGLYPVDFCISQRFKHFTCIPFANRILPKSSISHGDR